MAQDSNCEITFWLVLDSRTNGGIETHVQELARGLVARGYRTTVVFIKNHGPHPLRSSLQTEGIATITLDGGFKGFCRQLRKDRPGLVHSHGYKAGLYATVANALFDYRHVTTYHAGEFGAGKVAIYDWLHRQASRFNAASFAVSNAIAERVPKLPVVLDNFISLPDLPVERGTQLAFVGRFSEEKGVDRLVHIASRLRDINFHFYGDGPLFTELETQATSNCYFHGNQADMSEHWQNIGLLIMPSRHEGLPMAALEAMARRIPVIAFRVGGLGRLIDSGDNGWLIEPDNVDRFEKAIGEWLSLGEQQQERLRDAARARIEQRFSSQRVLPLILEHYRRATGKIFPACDAFCDFADRV